MEVSERIRSSHGDLTSAERRVAETVLAAPHTVAFGTVADLASSAGAGAATVVRLAAKLGYDGFTQLQQSVRDDLVHQLRPASERIREQTGTGVVGAHAAVELSNVQATLDQADPVAVTEVVSHLADLEHPVIVLSGDASTGVATQFVDELSLLRPAVSLLRGNEVAVRRAMGLVTDTATTIVIDLRRYDRWVLDTVTTAGERGWWIAALTDSYLSPLAAVAARTFVLGAGSVGPFDSHVGTLALLNLFVTEVAATLKDSATDRLDGIEAAWADVGALTDR